MHSLNLQIVFSTHPASRMPAASVPSLQHKHPKLRKFPNPLGFSNSPHITSKPLYIRYASTSPWEPTPVTYPQDTETKLLTQTNNIFESITSSESDTKPLVDTSNQPFVQPQYLKWPLWLLGPTLLLLTGVVPTLWLPISSIFMGPNIATLLALTGLDCIFNLGASLFLLMAHSSVHPKNNNQSISSKPPSSYQFWNMLANVIGFIVPLGMLLGAQNGAFSPGMPFVSFLVLLGPYFLLLSVQMLTEMLTWHWESPVWLVTPVVYEGYRLLQLMRGLKLGVEVVAPSWMVHMIRGLVCGWVVVLGVQLMRVAWYAGFTARAYKQHSDDDDYE